MRSRRLPWLPYRGFPNPQTIRPPDGQPRAAPNPQRRHSCLPFRRLSSRSSAAKGTDVGIIPASGGRECPRYGRQECLRYAGRPADF